MTYQTWIQIVKLMKSIWTRDDFLNDEYSVKAWFFHLQDISAEEVKAAVDKLIATSRFPPSVADIRQEVVELHEASTDWGEAWNEVMKAVGRYGYTQSEEAIESMNPMTKEAVKRLGWKQICESDSSGKTALRANFRMIYEQIQKKKREESQMPEELKARIDELNQLIGLTKSGKLLP